MDDLKNGPAMAKLTEKQRKFVHALFLAPRSHGAGLFAARAAGYGTKTSSNNSLSVIAYQMQNDPRVQAAISEASQMYLTTLGPPAVRALKKLLANPKHRDHGRALAIVMDRVTPVQSTAVLKVEGEVTLNASEAKHVMEKIEALASKFMVALPAPKILEHEETRQ